MADQTRLKEVILIISLYFDLKLAIKEFSFKNHKFTVIVIDDIRKMLKLNLKCVFRQMCNSVSDPN